MCNQISLFFDESSKKLFRLFLNTIFIQVQRVTSFKILGFLLFFFQMFDKYLKASLNEIAKSIRYFKNFDINICIPNYITRDMLHKTEMHHCKPSSFVFFFFTKKKSDYSFFSFLKANICAHHTLLFKTDLHGENCIKPLLTM